MKLRSNRPGLFFVGVTESKHYYPFGLTDENYTYVNPDYGDAHRYGFNGKENDRDLQSEDGSNLVLDYGFRIYNPAIARFLSVDPLTSEYPWYTPYQFAGNKPIAAVDLDGLEEYLHWEFEDGSRSIIRVKNYEALVQTEQSLDNYPPQWQLLINPAKINLVSTPESREKDSEEDREYYARRMQIHLAERQFQEARKGHNNIFLTAVQLWDGRDYLEAGIELIDGNYGRAFAIAGLSLLPLAAEEAGMMLFRASPSEINFTQPTASQNFSQNGTITDLANGLAKKEIDINDVPLIRVVEYEGKLWSLDNRRLAAFHESGIEEIPYLKVDLDNPEILREFNRKFNPIDGTGRNIIIVPNSSGRSSAEKVLIEHGKIKDKSKG